MELRFIMREGTTTQTPILQANTDEPDQWKSVAYICNDEEYEKAARQLNRTLTCNIVTD